jgi:aldehyde:ferredoxin oxidoreductase
MALTGYAGRQLRLILGEKRAVSEPLDEEFIRDFLGGTGYAARLLFEEQRAGLDPLAPESRMILATGPLTMNRIPGGGSVELCFKSPLTRGWGESRAGSDFGPDMRRAGFDFIIVQGRAESPLYVVVRDDKVEFRPAAHLSGKTVSEKQRIIRAELPEGRFSVGCIGPAGENLVKFAGVMFEQRAAGRGGAGAVFGSKNLLGIAVSGSGEVAAADPDGLKEVLRRASRTLRENPMSSAFRDNGTIGDMPGNDDGGDWPTKNWQANSWGRGTGLFDHYNAHNFIGPYPCYRGCFISCGRKVHVPAGPYRTPEHGGAEYESISCFTAYVLNEDMDAAVHSTYLCNEYGMDTISAGSVIAFAMECAERGLLPAAGTAGAELRWGNGAALPELVKMIALRRGIGDSLAEGVRDLAKKLGPEAESFAVHVKGLEGPAHDPRSGKALALSYGTGNRGMCHIHPVEAMAWDSGKMTWGLEEYGLADPEGVDRWAEQGKGREVKLLQDGLSLPDILGTCKFFMYAGITVTDWAEMLSALTGREVSARDLLAVSERVYTLQRLFNLREGMTGKDDAIPRRAVSVPVSGKYEGEEACATRDYGGMLREYYTARGWSADSGAPTPETLARLGLDNL